eukprot:9730507-Alexandrium_andersonii.AAC.1
MGRGELGAWQNHVEGCHHEPDPLPPLPLELRDVLGAPEASASEAPHRGGGHRLEGSVPFLLRTECEECEVEG